MKWYECALIGTAMAGLYGITLWASVQVRDAYLLWYDQYRLYSQENVTILNMGPVAQTRMTVMPVFDKNILLIPYVLPVVIVTLAYALLLSVPIWYPWAVSCFNMLADALFTNPKEDDVE